MVLNTEVRELLFDECGDITKIYLYLLDHMDSKTCVTGIKRRVSHQAIKELIEVPATKGRVSVPCDRRRARTLLNRMVAIGLIVDHGNCVFYLVHEVAHKSVSRRLAQGWPEASTDVINNNNDLGNSLAQGEREVGTHLTTTTTTTKFFQMFGEWEPTEGFAQDALRAGYDITGKHQALFNAALIDVRYAYMGKEELIQTRRNQIGWQSEVIRSMKYLLKQHLADVKKINSGSETPVAQSGKKPGAGVAGGKGAVSQLIPRVPAGDAELDRYYAQHKSEGAPAAKHTADFTYAMWRQDLTRWRNDKIRDGIISAGQSATVN